MSSSHKLTNHLLSFSKKNTLSYIKIFQFSFISLLLNSGYFNISRLKVICNNMKTSYNYSLNYGMIHSTGAFTQMLFTKTFHQN